MGSNPNVVDEPQGFDVEDDGGGNAIVVPTRDQMKLSSIIGDGSFEAIMKDRSKVSQNNILG